MELNFTLDRMAGERNFGLIEIRRGSKLMKKGYSKWDSTKYLTSEKRMQAYLDAAMKEDGNDPAFIISVMADIARARNMNQLAKDAGLSRSGLYKALSGEGKPEFATIMKVAGALGLKMEFRSI
jgi:probable addiction module antidote protein